MLAILEEAPSFTLPNGITKGATAATLRSLLSSEFDENEYSTFTSFSYYDYGADIPLDISLEVDNESGVLDEVSLAISLS